MEVAQGPGRAETEVEIIVRRRRAVHRVGNLEMNTILRGWSPNGREPFFACLQGIREVLVDRSLAGNGKIELIILKREATDFVDQRRAGIIRRRQQRPMLVNEADELPDGGQLLGQSLALLVLNLDRVGQVLAVSNGFVQQLLVAVVKGPIQFV